MLSSFGGLILYIASLEKILGIIVEESEEEREQQYQDTPKFDLIKELLHVKVSPNRCTA